MWLKLEMSDLKKSGLPTEAFIIYSLTKQLNKNGIKAYRGLLCDITGYSSRSVTRYFKLLKDKGLITQKTLYSPNSLKQSENNINDLFLEVYEKIKN